MANRHSTPFARAYACMLACVVLVAGCDPAPGTDAPVSDDGGTEDSDVQGTRPVFEAQFEAGPATLPRLTRSEYRNSVRDLFPGAHLVIPSELEPDTISEGLAAVGNARSSISELGAEQYEAAGFTVAAQVTRDPEVFTSIMPCEPTGVVDRACAREFIEPLARRAWRRTLSTEESDALLDLIEVAASELDSFAEGIEFGIAAILQSPKFLFRERTPVAQLSFLIWNSVPDQELLDAEEAGELDTKTGIRTQAERMLSDARAYRGVRALFSDLYQLDRNVNLIKDTTVYPLMSGTLGLSGREQTLRDLAWLTLEKQGDFRDMLVMPQTFLNDELAAVYGVSSRGTGEYFEQVELPPVSKRRGLLTQVSFLAGRAHVTSTSPTLRGKFIREQLLCHMIQPPPPGVDTSIPEPDPTLPTMRDRLKIHLEAPMCAGCHKMTDPIGLAFENFDGLGVWRNTENGVEIDASGDIDEAYQFDDAWGLAERLREHPDLPLCAVQRIWTYASGRPPAIGEEKFLRFLEEIFEWDEYRLVSLLVEIVANPEFRATP